MAQTSKDAGRHQQPEMGANRKDAEAHLFSAGFVIPFVDGCFLPKSIFLGTFARPWGITTSISDNVFNPARWRFVRARTADGITQQKAPPARSGGVRFKLPAWVSSRR